MRIGGKTSIPIDARLIVATNIPLHTMLEQGTIRSRIVQVYAAWLQRVGKKSIRTTRHKMGTHCRKRVRKLTKLLIHGLSSASKAGQGWLQKVYEVDPLICPKSQGAMSVVAVIEDPKGLGKIIEWAKQQERGLPVTVCARSPPELALAPV